MSQLYFPDTSLELTYFKNAHWLRTHPMHKSPDPPCFPHDPRLLFVTFKKEVGVRQDRDNFRKTVSEPKRIPSLWLPSK